jgi:two-component system LytT family response regulator
MTFMRILIVDDETPARTRLRKLLEELNAEMGENGVQMQIAEAANALEAMSILPAFDPQIVFLDIDMPKMNGFEFLQQLPDFSFQVIFQTAHDDFALKAFEANACDYLLKPYSKDRFAKAFSKACKQVSALPSSSLGKKVVDYLPSQNHYLSRLVVKSGARTRFVDIGEVTSFSSEEHITQVHLDSGPSFSIEPSLSHLEEQLNPAEFIRVHRNSIVKITLISGYKSQPEFTVQLKGGLSYKVARDRQKRLLEILKK